MAADSTRPPRDDHGSRHDGNHAAEAPGARGGETLAEKIRRYRQPAPAVESGGATVPAGAPAPRPAKK